MKRQQEEQTTVVVTTSATVKTTTEIPTEKLDLPEDELKLYVQDLIKVADRVRYNFVGKAPGTGIQGEEVINEVVKVEIK